MTLRFFNINPLDFLCRFATVCESWLYYYMAESKEPTMVRKKVLTIIVLHRDTPVALLERKCMNYDSIQIQTISRRKEI